MGFYGIFLGLCVKVDAISLLVPKFKLGNQQKPSPEGEGWVRGNQNKEKNFFIPSSQPSP